MENEFNNNTMGSEFFTPIVDEAQNYIKVIGVGGGGGNAVDHMYEEGIQGVDFILCNTDAQALRKSAVPIKIQLGDRKLGAGNKPEVGREAAESTSDTIRNLFDEETKMVFVTAGMGGGTGTGAAPVVARIAKEMGVLTVGIVTLPFDCEGRKRKQQAAEGINNMRKNVDALLIISNDKLRAEYGNMKLNEAFKKADDILKTAATGIAEIITVEGHVNVDFEDVNTVMRDSGRAIMGYGKASGEDRAQRAIADALNSQLLNDSNIKGANNILLHILSGSQYATLDEVTEIIDYVQDYSGNNADVIWGNGTDDSLGDAIAVTVIATGLANDEMESSNPETYYIKPEQVTTVEPIKNVSSAAEVVNATSSVVTNTNNSTGQQKIVFELFNDSAQTSSSADLSVNSQSVEQTKSDMTTQQEEHVSSELHVDDNQKKDDDKDDNIHLNVTEIQAVEVSVLEERPDYAVSEVPSASSVHSSSYDNPFYDDDDDDDDYTTNVVNSADVSVQSKEVRPNTIVVPEIHNDDERERQNNISRQRLRALSVDFSSEKLLNEIESVPAYLRRGVAINSEEEVELSSYTTSSLGVRQNNAFLHDNVD